MPAPLFRPARLMALVAALALAALAVPAARAQSPFAAALYVNDQAITNYDITQKIRFLEFIGATGDNAREMAIERLIEDRLQLQEVSRLGGRLTPDQVRDGMTEFAGRANLTADEMIARLAQSGVDRETFESFIRSGVLWRELVNVLYGPQIRITEAQIDQALSVEGVQPSTEVLISEIFLPSEPEFADQVQRIIPLIQQMTTESEFANAARQVSASPSGPSGGRVDRWINVNAMPADLGQVLSSAAVGTVIGPLDMPGAYAFFQLRARRDSRDVPAEAVQLTYRRALLPGGRSEANLARVAQIRDGIDSCVDFDARVLRAAPELTPEAAETLVQPLPQVPGPLRTELERLNPNELSANLVEGGNLVLLMLCTRQVAGESIPSRDQVRQALINRALEGHAMIHLQRLRAEADIRTR